MADTNSKESVEDDHHKNIKVEKTHHLKKKKIVESRPKSPETEKRTVEFKRPRIA